MNVVHEGAALRRELRLPSESLILLERLVLEKNSKFAVDVFSDLRRLDVDSTTERCWFLPVQDPKNMLPPLEHATSALKVRYDFLLAR